MSGLVALRQHNHQALRGRPKGRAAPLAIAIVLTMLPARIGYQDVAAMIARQPAVGESFRAHLIASPFGTIHAATFSFPQPVGTGIPAGAGLHVAAYAAGSDVTGALAHALPTAPGIDLQTTSSRRNFPEINRALKGPRLVPRVRPDFDSPQPSTTDGPNPAPGLQPVARPTPTAGAADEATTDSTETTSATPAPDNADFAYFDPSGSDAVESSLIDGDGATVQAARLYFGAASLGGTPATMEPWGPGQAPVFEPREPETAVAAPNAAAPFEVPRNETVAPKGEVTGAEHRPMSPAEHLGLIGATRAKQEKCLADAIYFEARGEPLRGQMAVAQVVVNRVFSGYYPHTICGVVYQNAHRHLACQFTFACDGIPDRINEPAAWERAKHIAREALDGKFWLNDIGKATHYHARWVHPWWVREMRKLDRIGVHTFYRPRNWGDGSKSPTWGDAEATKTAAKTL
ncbi:MAG TPA: cell wall hydrolase [Xanthobacteraceae bacterium]|nr:cell wall hydrolase [Xanthobacteraceae bacterium]